VANAYCESTAFAVDYPDPMNVSFRTGASLLAGCLGLTLNLPALELAPPFTDHAVLQRDTTVPVWGWDEQPGSTVSVTFGGQTKLTQVNASGLWRADLDPLPANATGTDLVVTRGHTSITLRDVVVGEVWLASGQSNMEWALGSSPVSLAAEKARPANPLIRHLRVDHLPADLPVDKVKTSGWLSATPDTISGFTGVGYYFARLVSETLNVPVGILHASWGGTPIESWIPEPVLRSSRAWPEFNRKWQAALKVWPQAYADQPGLEAAFQKAIEDRRTKGTPITMPWPRPPMGPGSAYGPGTLYNGMLAPLAPYALRGALWYQGESNVGRAGEYAELLPAMIQAWRNTWLQGDFPFLVVQLPNFSDYGKPDGRAWAELREAQESVLHVPAGGLAVIIDNVEPDNLHPVDKQPAGERLARLALNRVYDQRAIFASGPVLQAVRPDGPALRLVFSYAEGLKSTRPTVTGFELAGADRVFHPATAVIDGPSVVVSAAAVTAPVAVRYAFTNAPQASLVNAAGLPAAPFRTDDW